MISIAVKGGFALTIGVVVLIGVNQITTVPTIKPAFAVNVVTKYIVGTIGIAPVIKAASTGAVAPLTVVVQTMIVAMERLALIHTVELLISVATASFNQGFVA